MIVIKRNGEKVDYDLEKISIAIAAAFEELGKVFEDDDVLHNIDFTIQTSHPESIGVEEIQDIVEEALWNNGYYKQGRLYTRYRYKQEMARQLRNDQEVLQMVGGNEDSYWKTENSNKNSDLVTVQRDYLAGIISTDVARHYVFPKEIIEAHDKGWCHQHDMDYMAQNTLHNCDLINLEDMLQNGTCVNNVHINKPHRLITAMTITTQIMASVASSQYGGQSLTLTHLAPFVRESYYIHLNKYLSNGLDEEKSKELARIDTKKEIQDSVQTFNYQASTLFSLNGQAPFSSLFMYIGETEEYKEELCALIKEFLIQRLEGMPNRQGVNVTQAFPKILYVLEEDNYKPGTKYWELTKLAALCSSKRLTPDYISEKVMKEIKVNSNGEGDCFPCMGKCKL